MYSVTEGGLIETKATQSSSQPMGPAGQAGKGGRGRRGGAGGPRVFPGDSQQRRPTSNRSQWPGSGGPLPWAEGVASRSRAGAGPEARMCPARVSVCRWSDRREAAAGSGRDAPTFHPGLWSGKTPGAARQVGVLGVGGADHPAGPGLGRQVGTGPRAGPGWGGAGAVSSPGDPAGLSWWHQPQAWLPEKGGRRDPRHRGCCWAGRGPEAARWLVCVQDWCLRRGHLLFCPLGTSWAGWCRS